MNKKKQKTKANWLTKMLMAIQLLPHQSLHLHQLKQGNLSLRWINCGRLLEILLYNENSTIFSLDRIRIALTTYGWSDQTTAGNIKLALEGKAINRLNPTRDPLDISTRTNIKPEFIEHFNIKTNTVNIVCETLQNSRRMNGTTLPTWCWKFPN